MTKITLKTPAVRGKLTIEGSEMRSDQFQVGGAMYLPYTFEAETLGQALDYVLANLHKLQRNQQSNAVHESRSKRMKALWTSGAFTGSKTSQSTTAIKVKPVVADATKLGKTT